MSASKLLLGTYSPHLLPFCQCRLSPKEQRYHGLIVGKSGAGKSKLLQSIFQSHLQHSLKETRWPGQYSSHGATVLEPHHDLSFDILSTLVASGFYKRPDAYQRVVYIDFGQDAYVPFNVLAGGGDPHEKASLVLDAMLRVFPELQTAPLFTELFLSGVVVLIENQLPITCLQRLLSDPTFRRACLERLPHDELVQLTFRNFEQLGRDQVEAAGSTVRRAFQLSFNATTRLSLGQPDNKLPLRQFMDEGRFLIFNLGGIRDELSRRIIGATLMVQLEQAALSRTDLLPQARVPHTLLVDEWPVFAATEDSLGHILSQARKFALNIYLACQSVSQISAKRLSGAFENCKLGIFFALGHDSAELSSRQIGDLDVFALKEASAAADDGDARSPTSHDQYLPLLEQIQVWTNELKNLSPRYCYAKIDTAKPIKLRTPLVPSPRVDPDQLAQVLATYRQLYQRSRAEAEAAMARLNLPAVPGRDDITRNQPTNAFAWASKSGD